VAPEIGFLSMKVVPEQAAIVTASDKTSVEAAKKKWSTPRLCVERITQAEGGGGLPIDFTATGSRF
jgi:hypothetical protein